MKMPTLFDAPDGDDPDNDVRNESCDHEWPHPGDFRPEDIRHWRDWSNGQFVPAPSDCRYRRRVS